MKKTMILLILLCFVLSCAACQKGIETTPSVSPTPTQTSDQENGAGAPIPSAPTSQDDTQDDGSNPPSPSGTNKSDLYDPSIFVIQAEGTWRQELAPGYYADYECELYVDKFDANDNRSAAGLYTGVFWMKASIDAAGYLEEMLKNVPVEASFEAGGEGVCDNLTMHLLDGYERDPFGDFTIPDGQGGVLEPAKDALAGEGGFIVVGTQVYLDAQAHGAGGESVTYQDSQTGDGEMYYVIQIEPDPTNSATERKVKIHLSSAQGASVTLEGVWSRLPGYSDDMLEYANSGKAGEVLAKHLK